MSTKLYGYAFAAILASAALFGGKEAKSNTLADNANGIRNVYGELPVDQAENLSTGEQILKVAGSGAPSAIWETLERGERVECLDCIPAVEPLLYDANPQTREISAWWLRRRVFGVFGPGEAYERTVKTLQNQAEPANRRAHAASALGEFLVAPGIDACAEAIKTDPAPEVRAAAASALGRLNSDGAGALTVALSDSDSEVKLAALKSAGRINTLVDVSAIAKLSGDKDANVRKRAIEVLDTYKAKDTAAAVAVLAKNDPDSEVRLAACHALGSFGSAAQRGVLEDLAKNDPNSLVRDQARIALRRL
ncbi:MAG: HEAT repeat domain-containing protein [Polyangiaceae bacterium]